MAAPLAARRYVEREAKEYFPEGVADILAQYHGTLGIRTAIAALEMLPNKMWPKPGHDFDEEDIESIEEQHPHIEVIFNHNMTLAARTGEDAWVWLTSKGVILKNLTKQEIIDLLIVEEFKGQIVRIYLASGVNNSPDKMHRLPQSASTVLYQNIPGQPGYDPELV